LPAEGELPDVFEMGFTVKNRDRFSRRFVGGGFFGLFGLLSASGQQKNG
jgi:hypothetical protein